MARKPRLHYPGAVYHVMIRGNGGQQIFLDDKDRSRFYLLVQEGVERYHHRVHALCLMDNHVHLAVEVSEVPLSRIMQNICFRYTRWVNWRQKRTGHVFQGRYKAIVVDKESYLLELIRYIHLNPIRAGIAKLPEDYMWSSHRAYMGGEIIPWLNNEWVLSQFGPKPSVARNRYSKFVIEGLNEKHRPEFHSGTVAGRILGDDEFAEKAFGEANLKPIKQLTLDEVIETVCSLYSIGEVDLAATCKERRPGEARSIIAWLVREAEGLSLTTLGKRFRRDTSSLSLAAKRLQERMRIDEALAKRVRQMQAELYQMQ